MAGAFASGFQMGGALFNQAEKNRLEQAAEERRAIEFAQAQEDRARQVGLRGEEDMLRQQLTRPNAENYALSAPGQGVGLRMGAQPAAALPEEGLAMPQMAAPAGGLGMREGAAPGGLRAPTADTRQPTFNAAPTGAGAEEILGRMALIKGDTAGFRAAQVAARGYKYEDTYKKSMADWNAMDDEAKQALIDKASYDTNIKGFGTWVPGKGKQAGYMNYMAPGQDPIKLSAKEAGELFALTNAMEHDPMRARGEMDKVSDKVRLLASQAFEAQTKGITASNTATHYANQDVLEQQKAGAMGEYYKSRGAAERMGAAQYFEGKDGNTYASVPVMGPKGLSFETVQVNQPGVKFNKLGGAGDGKPVEVKEEGTKVTIGGQLKIADGLGGWLDPKGVLPSERTKVLSAANIPDNLVAQLPWNSSGTSVGFAGQAYNVRDPKDMKQLKADYERLGRTSIEVDEAQKAGLGLHSRMRSLEGRTPSPYDSPDVWATYRAAPNR